MQKSGRGTETWKERKWHTDNALGPDHKDCNSHWKPTHWLGTAHCFDVKQMKTRIPVMHHFQIRGPKPEHVHLNYLSACY